ncbi:hypothetical protein BDN72DRAFT_850435 [Pluteus cervinus]|uniref:Uncharacterized protein n=1 Tax=Pluteus cervinus TaxID=181527 RepID=A0ACD3A6U4_9AGAR|nr:hypothetical protein BDN72DRAFT_850435 [Pluteus cervinus]
MKVSPAGLVLPLELEHIILQMALENDMTDAKNLLFVAKYVFDWLIPILYRVVILSRSLNAYLPLHLPITKLPRYGRYVQHLFIESAPDEIIDQYLEFCPNVTDFAYWTTLTEPRINSVVRLPNLIQLGLNFHDILDIRFTPSALAAFSKITHVDAEALDVSFLSHFPSLTHLVLRFDHEPDMYNDVLERHPRLKVFILWEYGNFLFPKLECNGIPGVNDARVVHLKYGTMQNWKMNALGDPQNSWAFAERVVEERLAHTRAQKLADHEDA